MLMRSVLLLLAFVSFSGQSETIKENDAFAVLGEPKYALTLLTSITSILRRQKAGK
jgi:hypothetical protein